MRILVTNDDGVFAPGIAALANGLSKEFGGQHDITVVAPLVDHSGAGAAVGAVYERESIAYEAVEVRGIEHVPTYGIDGTPALAVILACIGGFGERPDMVVSGINHGTNAGRSALHSGTIGAALTGAQFGVRGLAVSIAWSDEPVPWETPVALATHLVPVLATMEPATVLNLNCPAVPLDRLGGVRPGRLGTAGLIRSVRDGRPEPPVNGVFDRTAGAISLTLRGGRGSDPTHERAELDPGSDAAIVESGWASVTPLFGVREDRSETGSADLVRAVAALRARVGG